MSLGTYVACGACGASGGFGAPACSSCIVELLAAGIAVGYYFDTCYPDMPDYDPTPVFDPNNPPPPPSDGGDAGGVYIYPGAGGVGGMIGVPIYGTKYECNGEVCVLTRYIKYWMWLRD